MARVREKIRAATTAELSAAFQKPIKFERRDALSAIKKKFAAEFVGEGEGKVAANVYGGLLHDVEADVMRNAVLDTKKRVDGRDLTTVRPIVAEVGILPRTHGSALFTRGETQALCVCTLGTAEDEQFVDSLEGTGKQTFMLHYNFPPYSVGETGRMGAPGRREIGHGKLAWRAIHPMLPKKEDFPYTIRVVSEITESNGSSSMASVCGTSLALMDAGVPLKKPTAGIAMGLILEGDRYAVLSDILGDEDHLGDMDFKVAGTEDGITSLADGHQDRRHHRGNHEGRAGPGQGRPPAHPGRDEQGADRRPRRAGRTCPAHRADQDPHRQDPRRDRHRRQGDPRDRGKDRRQDQCGRRRHREGGVRRCTSRSRRRSSGFAA